MKLFRWIKNIFSDDESDIYFNKEIKLDSGHILEIEYQRSICFGMGQASTYTKIKVDNQTINMFEISGYIKPSELNDEINNIINYFNTNAILIDVDEITNYKEIKRLYTHYQSKIYEVNEQNVRINQTLGVIFVYIEGELLFRIKHTDKFILVMKEGLLANSNDEKIIKKVKDIYEVIGKSDTICSIIKAKDYKEKKKQELIKQFK